MNNLKKSLLLAAGLLCCLTPGAGARPPILQVLMEASHSVVIVKAENGKIFREEKTAPGKLSAVKAGRRTLLRPATWTRTGAGIIINAGGMLAVNAHTVNHAARITVITDGHAAYPAKLLYIDPALDLALLKIEPAAPLAALPLGDSDQLRLRSAVFSIGNSPLLKNTLSEGRLTGIGIPRTRGHESKSPRTQLLQVSFNVYPGDSGSPVFNEAGEVVGIISAAIPRRGKTAFAIPSNFISRAFSGGLSTSPPQKGSGAS